MKRVMTSVEEASRSIQAGKRLLVAGDEALLRQLPKGHWIGGTIPYFMGEDGGVTTAHKLLVTDISSAAHRVSIGLFGADTLEQMVREGPDHGLSFAIIPASSPAHLRFALEAPTWKEILLKPVVGWISGVNLADLGKVKPKVFNGETGAASEDQAAVMRVTLPETMTACVDIVNVFEQGDGDVITFDESGFAATGCKVNGKPRNMAEYLKEKAVDLKLPLVADYYGAMINTSFQGIDEAKKTVSFYAPVFEGVEYKIAKPVADYPAAFVKAVPQGAEEPLFSCNCILNYLYSNLEGRKTGSMVGPITFGEIAYQLLNQTLVYVRIEER